MGGKKKKNKVQIAVFERAPASQQKDFSSCFMLVVYRRNTYSSSNYISITMYNRHLSGAMAMLCHI